MQLINKLNHIIFVDLHHRTAERVQPASSVHLTRRRVKHHSELTTRLTPSQNNPLRLFFSLLRTIHARHQVNIPSRIQHAHDERQALLPHPIASLHLHMHDVLRQSLQHDGLREDQHIALRQFIHEHKSEFLSDPDFPSRQNPSAHAE